jgi:hypothetical protein
LDGYSTTDRTPKSEGAEVITREPEQVKAFRDTWRDGVHSYLTYLRDRLTLARDLLASTGSLFVQIGDENVHRVRALLDEVFGDANFVSLISVQTTTGFEAKHLGNMSDFVRWYARDIDSLKTHPPFYRKEFILGEGNARWLLLDDFKYRGVTADEKRGLQPVPTNARPYKPDNILSQGRSKDRQPSEFRGRPYDSWDKNSHWKANCPVGMERLARSHRIHVAENSIHADSPEGQIKEAGISRREVSRAPTFCDVRQGFVYERLPHVKLGQIANNAEIDVIWEKFQRTLEPLREEPNRMLKKNWQEWEIPREADDKWSAETNALHRQWWQSRIARQKEIDASIAAKAEFEYLYDKPYEDKTKVRVAGPFTVESISPHRVLAVGEDDELIDPQRAAKSPAGDEADFVQMILENLRTAGVQQAHKEDKIDFTTLAPWPGRLICAEGRY